MAPNKAVIGKVQRIPSVVYYGTARWTRNQEVWVWISPDPWKPVGFCLICFAQTYAATSSRTTAFTWVWNGSNRSLKYLTLRALLGTLISSFQLDSIEQQIQFRNNGHFLLSSPVSHCSHCNVLGGMPESVPVQCSATFGKSTQNKRNLPWARAKESSWI